MEKRVHNVLQEFGINDTEKAEAAGCFLFYKI